MAPDILNSPWDPVIGNLGPAALLASYIFCDAWRAAASRGPAVQDDD